jgi:hypothetical protein
MTVRQIEASSELFSLLAKELEERISVDRASPEFLKRIGELPVGLRAMGCNV